MRCDRFHYQIADLLSNSLSHIKIQNSSSRRYVNGITSAPANSSGPQVVNHIVTSSGREPSMHDFTRKVNIRNEFSPQMVDFIQTLSAQRRLPKGF